MEGVLREKNLMLCWLDHPRPGILCPMPVQFKRAGCSHKLAELAIPTCRVIEKSTAPVTPTTFSYAQKCTNDRTEFPRMVCEDEDTPVIDQV